MTPQFWRNVTIWLAAYFSPVAYFILLMLIDRLQIAPPPAPVVVTLFILIPLVALFVCGWVVWRSGMIGARRMGWMIFTVVAWLLQIAVLLFILISVLTAMISYAQ